MSHEPGVTSQEPRARGQEPGARSHEPGATSQGPGARGQEDYRRIYDLMELHAELIYKEAKIETPGGNHMLHQGLALLYAGVLFPENKNSQKYRRKSLSIIVHHLANEINSDGASIEWSPSYSHFIARMYLESYLLLCANLQNFSPKEKAQIEIYLPKLRESIQKQYRFLWQICTPSGYSLPISDSYFLNVENEKKILMYLMPELSEEDTTSSFSAEYFRVVRKGPLSLYIDASPQKMRHHHPGKPNIVLYYENSPVIIDSGSCNYDSDIYRDWYTTPLAHNTVCIEQEKQTDVFGDEVIEVIDLEKNEDCEKVKLKRKSKSCLWERTIHLTPKTMEVHDCIVSEKNVICKLLFHFSPEVKCQKQEKFWQISSSIWNLNLHSDLDFKGKRGAVVEENQKAKAPFFQSVKHGQQIEFRTHFTFK